MKKSSILLYIVLSIGVTIIIWGASTRLNRIILYQLSYDKLRLTEHTTLSAKYIKERIIESANMLRIVSCHITPYFFDEDKYYLNVPKLREKISDVGNISHGIKNIMIVDPFGKILISYPKRGMEGINIHEDIREYNLFNIGELSSTPTLKVFKYHYLSKDMKLKTQYALLFTSPIYKKWNLVGRTYGIIGLSSIVKEITRWEVSNITISGPKGEILYTSLKNPKELTSTKSISTSSIIKVLNLSLTVTNTERKEKLLSNVKKTRNLMTVMLIAIASLLIVGLVIMIQKDRKFIRTLKEEVEEKTSELQKSNDYLLNLFLLSGEIIEADNLESIKGISTMYISKIIKSIINVSEAVPTQERGKYTLRVIEGKPIEGKIVFSIGKETSRPIFGSVEDIFFGIEGLETLRKNGFNYAFIIPITPSVGGRAETSLTLIAFTKERIKEPQKILSTLVMLKNEIELGIAKIKLYEKVKKEAITDHLTGTYNRRRLDEIFEIEVERAIRYKRPLSITISDIDRFKEVNDTLGHKMGDKVLIDTAHIMLESIRKTDIVARYGGDEFAIIFPETQKETAEKIMLRIREKIEDYAKGIGIPISISFGVASYPEDGNSSQELLKVADSNMYQDKMERGAKR
ncbi:MAG: GGDEF domain-containing protein [Synergistetes bacterium]|nr:GGDEF domain-containing protein [Synergistota bacterium]